MGDGQNHVQSGHNVIMEDRKKLMVTGVTDVLSFDENEIRVVTSLGELVIAGAELEILNLSRENCQLDLSGQISELIYSEQKKEYRGLFSRILK